MNKTRGCFKKISLAWQGGAVSLATWQQPGGAVTSQAGRHHEPGRAPAMAKRAPANKGIAKDLRLGGKSKTYVSIPPVKN